MAWTNLGKQRMFEEFFASGAIESEFRLVLCSAVGDWNADTSSTTDVSAASSLISGNQGGTSGIIVVRDGTGDQANFDVSSATQLNLSAVRAVLQTGNDDFQFSGLITGARYVVLAAGPDSEGTFNFEGGHEIYAWWDIGQPTNIAAGNTLTITALSLQGQ